METNIMEKNKHAMKKEKPLPYCPSKSSLKFKLFSKSHSVRELIRLWKDIVADNSGNINKHRLTTIEFCELMTYTGIPDGYSNYFPDGTHWLDRLNMKKKQSIRGLDSAKSFK